MKATSDRILTGALLTCSCGLLAGEIAVQDAALLVAELAAELRLMDVTAPAGAKSEEEREKEMLFNLIQTCVLIKLLGAGSDSGRLKIGELSALLEDAWMLAVPINGVRVSQLLAQLRFSLLQQVRYLDQIVCRVCYSSKYMR
jgi:hypothetical protein